MSYAKEGCPADCGPNWTKDHIEAAIVKGPHASAMQLDALQALLDETREKVANWHATSILRYGNIMDALPEKLRISPVAMISHKSKAFSTILVYPSDSNTKEFSWNQSTGVQ